MFKVDDLLTEGTGEGMIMLDTAGVIQYTNPAITRISGFTALELQNKPVTFLHVSMDEFKLDYALNCAEKDGRYTIESWKLKKDGSRYWGELVLYPLYRQQTLEGFSGTLRDTSDKKESELLRRQSEERYRLMVDAFKEYAILMLDPSGNILVWNEGASIMKGYTANEMIGKHFSILYSAEDVQANKPEADLETALRAGKQEKEGWRLRKNGSVFWANSITVPLLSQDNKLTGFSMITRDLTSFHQHQESIQQREQRYRLLVQQVHDYAIFMMDEKGRILSWNEGAKRIKGYEPDEIIGKYFTIFYPEEDIISGKPALELKIAKKTGKFEEEGWRLRKDGSLFWANVVITAIFNNEQALLGYSKVTRDLTEKKEKERELKATYEQYRQLAKELSQLNTDLSNANQELEQFTSIVSHDLQEPIRTIKSYLQLIDKSVKDGNHHNLQKYVDKSFTAATRMRELIQHVLAYSQISKKELVGERLSIREVVDEAVQNIKLTADNANAHIELQLDTAHVIGDRIQLVQIFQNLISNAIKFNNSAQRQIVISAKMENEVTKFTVSDNGIGIAKENIDKIFEIFRRLDVSKHYEGTGIGLAICKKIVDRHKGRIWPEMNPGGGTRFCFTISNEITTQRRDHEKM